MPLFHYKVRDKEGKDIEGDQDAKDQYELARALRSQGFSVLSVLNMDAAAARTKFQFTLPLFLQRVATEEKMNFTRNLAVMVGAGLSLSRALTIMSRETKNTKFKLIILSLTDTVTQGKTFAEALGEYNHVFPKFYQEMVRAGELSGKLEESLKLIAMQLKKDYSLRRKVRSAMIYPLIILAAMVGIGIMMLIFVVPTLLSVFKELNVELPRSTQFIIYVSNSLLRNGLIFLGALALISYGVYRGAKTKKGRDIVDWGFIHFPLIGGINQKFNTARTFRTLSSLISAGVEILEALIITKGVLQNHYYQGVLDDAREKIQRGETIAKAFLGAEYLYPSLTGEMISVGEETGELSTMLLRLATFYEAEVAAATKDLSTIIEPALMIIIGVVVGFFAVSMISPMYNIVNTL